jgi:hypothetical protein
MRRSTPFELRFREACPLGSTSLTLSIAFYRAFGLQLRSRRDK